MGHVGARELPGTRRPVRVLPDAPREMSWSRPLRRPPELTAYSNEVKFLSERSNSISNDCVRPPVGYLPQLSPASLRWSVGRTRSGRCRRPAVGECSLRPTGQCSTGISSMGCGRICERNVVQLPGQPERGVIVWTAWIDRGHQGCLKTAERDELANALEARHALPSGWHHLDAPPALRPVSVASTATVCRHRHDGPIALDIR
jgi:hypothetical protein